MDISNGAYASMPIFTRFLQTKTPWGCYFAENFSGSTLFDSSGNNRHATTTGTITKTTASGNGATGNITYISGTTASTLTFPSGSIPRTFTILSLTRYTGGTNGRILQTLNTGNFLHGHWYGYRGVCHYDGWKTPIISVGTLTNWLCCIGKNNGSTPGNILIDGIASGNATGGTGGGTYQLGINTGLSFGTTERSDWALSCVIIWDQSLTDQEMIDLNTLINNYKTTGASNDIKSNTTYPIIKDINGNIINPLAWYKFDNANLLVDSSGNNYTLTNSSAVSLTTTNFIKGDSSAIFNGSSFLHIPYTNNLFTPTSGFSISFWAYIRRNAAILQSLISTRPSNGSLLNGYTCYLGDGGFSLQCGNGTNTWYYGGSTSAGTISSINFQWYHIVWISKIGLQQLYLNGVLVGSGTDNVVANVPSGVGNFQIGTNIMGSYKIENGTCYDDIRFYSGITLTQDQVLQLYNPVSYSQRDDTQMDENAKTVSNIELIQYPFTFPDNDSIGRIITERNRNGTIYYVQTYRINNLLYTIKFSSYNENNINASPLYLFDKNTNNSLSTTNNGGCFANMRDNRYDTSTGNYTGNKTYKEIQGEWVSITFPEQFILKQYGFIAKKGLENCAPGKWSVYADNENPQLIDTNNIRLSYVDYYKSSSRSTYIKQLQTNNIKTNTYTFVFQATAQSDRNVDQGTSINFIEILLFGAPS